MSHDTSPDTPDIVQGYRDTQRELHAMHEKVRVEREQLHERQRRSVHPDPRPMTDELVHHLNVIQAGRVEDWAAWDPKPAQTRREKTRNDRITNISLWQAVRESPETYKPRIRETIETDRYGARYFRHTLMLDFAFSTYAEYATEVYLATWQKTGPFWDVTLDGATVFYNTVLEDAILHAAGLHRRYGHYGDGPYNALIGTLVAKLVGSGDNSRDRELVLEPAGRVRKHTIAINNRTAVWFHTVVTDSPHAGRAYHAAVMKLYLKNSGKPVRYDTYGN